MVKRRNTGRDPRAKELKEAERVLGLHPLQQKDHPSSCPADPSKLTHIYGSRPEYYIDRPFTCRRCGKREIWKAKDQKWYCEEAKRPILAVPVECHGCRNVCKQGGGNNNLVAKAFEIFAAEVAATPAVTLRGGNAIDDLDEPPEFDLAADTLNDDYIETYHWGISYLDTSSWRHYLPHLIEYALRHMREGGNPVIERLLLSLRPRGQEPPRLPSLSAEQEALVTQFLEVLAFSQESANQELAGEVLEEWWIPGAR